MSQSGLNGRQHWKLRSSWIKKIFKRNRSPCHESTSDFFIKKIYHDIIRESLSTFPFSLWLFSKGCVKNSIMGLWRTLQVSQLVGVSIYPEWWFTQALLYINEVPICRSLYRCLKTFILFQQHLIHISSEDLNTELSPILDSTFSWEFSVF